MNWTNNEIQYLKINYPIYGMIYCSVELNRTKESIYSKVKELQIKRNSIRYTERWSKEDIDFIIENYNKKGSKYCSVILNKNSKKTTKKANSLDILLNNEIFNEVKKENGIKIRSNSVDYNTFLKFDTKEIVYILGLLWGDGNLNIKYNRISINMAEHDINELISIFKKTGDWIISKPFKKYFKNKEVKTQRSISTHNINIAEKLINLDFHEKSKQSAIKLLNNIDKSLINYFFRGFFDADGNIGVSNDKYKYLRIRFSGDYEHDWSYFNILNIDYKIYKYVTKQGRYSQLCIQRKDSVNKFLNLIYNNYNFGLSRKHKIYEESFKR